jgi:hypothetical protein
MEPAFPCGPYTELVEFDPNSPPYLINMVLILSLYLRLGLKVAS